MPEFELTPRPLTPLPLGDDDVATAVRLLHRRRAARAARLASATVAAVAAVAVAANALVAPANTAIAPATPDVTESPASGTPSPEPGASGSPSGSPTATPGGRPPASPVATPSGGGDPVQEALRSPSARPERVTSPEPADPRGPRRPPLKRTVTQSGTWVDPGGGRAGSDGPIGCTEEWCVYLVANDDGQWYQFSACRQSGDAALTFDTELEVDFAIARDGTELWRWSTGQRFAAEESAVSVPGPGCAHWTLEWDRTLDDGSRLPGGRYTISATPHAAELSPRPVTREWGFQD